MSAEDWRSATAEQCRLAAAGSAVLVRELAANGQLQAPLQVLESLRGGARVGDPFDPLALGGQRGRRESLRDLLDELRQALLVALETPDLLSAARDVTGDAG